MARNSYTEEQLAKIRRICKTDLYALGHDILQKPNWAERTHRPMCEFYIRKNPDVTFEQFGRAYKGPRDRMQLIQRRAFKSTIKILDDVQWIINYPEIRICSVTAENKLATAFIDELIGYFTIRGKAKRNPETNLVEGGEPTFFQMLFPQHCITEDEATLGDYTSPASKGRRDKFKESTAGTLSMVGTSSGWGCDIIDFDDPVSDKNAETGNLLEKLYDRIHMISNTMVPHGFRNFVATRYDVGDPYGKIAEELGCKVLYGDFENESIKYMCRPCWWLKDKPYQQPDYRTWAPKSEDVDLHFPEWITFDVLIKKMKNTKTFSSQQLNAPTNQIDVTFPREFVAANAVHPSALPKVGLRFNSWDFAYGHGDEDNGDFSVGVCGFLDTQRRWWVEEIVCEHLSPSEKCFEVVKMIRATNPTRTCIEDTPGVKGAMAENIDRRAKIEKVPTTIDWVMVGQGIKDAKYLRIAPLHTLILEKRLFFLNNLVKWDEMLLQFSNVRRQRSKHRNDIPDAIARMVQQYSNYVLEMPGGMPMGVPMTNEEAAKKFFDDGQRELRDLLLGNGKYSEDGPWARGEYNADYVPPPMDADPLDPSSPSYGLDLLTKDNF